MNQWNDIAHQSNMSMPFPDSPTPIMSDSPPTTSDEKDPPYSAAELENQQRYREHLNDISLRAEGGFHFRDTRPYDENLLIYTLGLSSYAAPHHKGSDLEFPCDSGENLDDEILTR
jgi:hypothetical protein